MLSKKDETIEKLNPINLQEKYVNIKTGLEPSVIIRFTYDLFLRKAKALIFFAFLVLLRNYCI